jgi:hypothetical protein
MTEILSKKNLFRDVPKPPSNAQRIDNAVREILRAEAVDRNAKTKRLKEARLEREAQQQAALTQEGTTKRAKRRRIVR